LPRLAVTVLLLALLAATTTAFALTEALKLEPTPISRPRFNVAFSPGCACIHDTARLPVRLKEAETIDATIVDSEGDEVRTLAVASPREPGRTVLLWDGKDDRGEIAPDGTYRLRLSFERSDRSIVVPNPIQVDTRAPTIELVSVTPRAPEPAEEVTAAARSNERARLLVYADGRLVARSRAGGPGVLRLMWDGTGRRGNPLPAGEYALTLAAQDRAGNISDQTAVVPVQLGAAG
jgi:flagellar hook assembly protein FlgD